MKYNVLMWLFLAFKLTFANQLFGLVFVENGKDCRADFDAHNISKFSVQFINQSEGDVENWLWDFGDGTTSAEENPIHQYTTSGTFEVVLTIITSNDCSDFIKKQIEIAEGNHIYGEVMMGSNFLPKGKLNVYFSYNGGNYFELDTVVDIISGGFDIPYTENVPYFLYAESTLELPEFHFPEYFPTYFGGSIFWEDGIEMLPEESEFVEISLVKRDSIFYGNGSIAGMVYNYSEESLEGLNVYLLDMDKNPLKQVELPDDYTFELLNVPYGQYYVALEKIGLGLSNKLNYVETSGTNPDEYMYIEIGGAVSAEVTDNGVVQTLIHPNPFLNNVNLHFNNPAAQAFKIEVLNSMGQSICRKQVEAFAVDYSIDLGGVESGFYLVKTQGETFKVLKLE